MSEDEPSVDPSWNMQMQTDFSSENPTNFMEYSLPAWENRTSDDHLCTYEDLRPLPSGNPVDDRFASQLHVLDGVAG